MGPKKSKKSKKEKKDKKSKEDKMAAKRAAMMQAAADYEKKRSEKSKRETKKEAEEDARDKKADGSRKGAAFLKDVKHSMADGQSMEQRIQSRKFNQQRRTVDF